MFPDLFDEPKAFDDSFNLSKNIVMKDKILQVRTERRGERGGGEENTSICI